jgi:hypothetical protein
VLDEPLSLVHAMPTCGHYDTPHLRGFFFHTCAISDPFYIALEPGEADQAV